MPISVWLDRAKRSSPHAVLAVGWVGMVLYALPGYLSYDSIHALADARSGKYRDLAGVIWRITDYIIPGPFGMLVIQTTCFVVGAYLLLCRTMPPRWAAACAGAVLWFPAISGTLGVIWTASHGCAWLMLGAGCLGSERRGVRIAGLAALALGAAMVDGGPIILLPLVFGLWRFVDGRAERIAQAPGQRWRRLAICAGAWLAAASLAVLVSSRFSDPRAFERALLDIAGTVHHGPPASDAELRPAFASPPGSGLDGAVRAAYQPQRPLAENQAAAAGTFGAAPRDAVVHVRDAIVAAHRGAYVAYRWEVFRQLLQLDNRPVGSQVYLWFTDVQDLSGSAGLIQHNAASSRLQGVLQQVMAWLGATWLFVPYVYLLLSIALIPLCFREREAGALVASGIAGELAAFLVGSDPALRGSLWLAITTVVAAVLLFARRAHAAASARSYDGPTSERSRHRPDTPASSTMPCATADS